MHTFLLKRAALNVKPPQPNERRKELPAPNQRRKWIPIPRAWSDSTSCPCATHVSTSGNGHHLWIKTKGRAHFPNRASAHCSSTQLVRGHALLVGTGRRAALPSCPEKVLRAISISLDQRNRPERFSGQPSQKSDPLWKSNPLHLESSRKETAAPNPH